MSAGWGRKGLTSGRLSRPGLARSAELSSQLLNGAFFGPFAQTVSGSGRATTVASGTPYLIDWANMRYISPGGRASGVASGTALVGKSKWAGVLTGWTYTGNWNTDNTAPGSKARYFSNAANDYAEVSFRGTWVKIEVQKEYGWGTGTVRVDGAVVGSISSYDLVGGGFLDTYTFSGLSAGPHTLRITVDSALFLVITGITFGIEEQTASPGGMSATFTSGSATVSRTGGGATISPPGGASALALGQPALSRGAVTLSPAGRVSSLLFGTATIGRGAITVTPTGRASGMVPGTAVLGRGPVTVSPTGRSSGFSSGNATIGRGTVSISPFGLGSGVVAGTAALSARATVSPSGRASAFVSGTISVSRGTMVISPGGRASTFAAGSATLTKSGITLSPSGRAASFVSGTATLSRGGVVVSPSGKTSSLLFGSSAILRGSRTVSPAGRAASFVSGTGSLSRGPVTVSPGGRVSGFAAGTATLARGVITASPGGRAPAFVSGTASVLRGAKTVSPSGKASGFAAGTSSVLRGAVTLQPAGRASTWGAGTQSVLRGARILAPSGRTSALAIGAFSVSTVSGGIVPAGRASSLAFGLATLHPGPVSVWPSGRASAVTTGPVSVSTNAHQWTSAYHYLHILDDTAHAGQNWVDSRELWIPAQDDAVSISGTWLRDGGALDHASSVREPRIFCTTGSLTLHFSGSNVAVRIATAYGWGSFTASVDGGAAVTVSCDYAVHAGRTYLDVLVADHLTDTPHTLTITVANAANDWIVITGFKIFSPSRNDLARDQYVTPFSYAPSRTLTFFNGSTDTVLGATVSFPAEIKGNTGLPLGTVTLGDIAPGAAPSVTIKADLSARQASGEVMVPVAVTGSYRDALGDPVSVPQTMTPTAGAALTLSNAAHWSFDTEASSGRALLFTTTVNAWVEFTVWGTSFSLDLLRDWGYGTFDVLIDGTVIGTAATAVDARDIHTFTFTTTAGSHTCRLKAKSSGGKVHGLVEARFNAILHQMTVTETLRLALSTSLAPPFALSNVSLAGTSLTWTPPARSRRDWSIPRTNDGLTAVQIEQRFPTFAVCYQSGFAEILKGYDLVVIEPLATTRKEVEAYQARGIRVLGYVSFGEEIGDPENPFAATPVLKPLVGDGAGPGGYASYYRKLGDLAGEQNECAHDTQRTTGAKACALARGEYWTSPGRCSKACRKDSRTGYTAWQSGGACAGGYTAANRWQRDAMSACTNAACPGYQPVNSGCPVWAEAVPHWSQDFSATSNYPDENGIWASFFCDATPAWQARLASFYLPTVFGAGAVHTETLAVASYADGAGGTVLGVLLSHTPIDRDEPFTVTAAGAPLIYGVDYSFDSDSGAVILQATTSAGGTIAPGTSVSVTYTRKGLQCDGVFMDTVDTVDVYPSGAFQGRYVALINGLKALYPTKLFCSNRGFTILGQIIGSCSYVMFESFLTDYNWATGLYGEITDTASIAYNNGIIAQLDTLRSTHIFDVLALNYCQDDDATLRALIDQRCTALGYMSWTSTILLNNPRANDRAWEVQDVVPV